MIVRDKIITPSLDELMFLVEEEGGEGAIKIVGGAVRNAFLGREIIDIDLATSLSPSYIFNSLINAGYQASDRYIAYGTISLVLSGKKIDITSLRTDDVCFGRQAISRPSQSWYLDASRRDFTINALYYSRNGELFDYTGKGLDDLECGRVRFIGDPAVRIKEDYLRILRFFRFSADVSINIDDNSFRACVQFMACVNSLSRERISYELKRLIHARNLRAHLTYLDQSKIAYELIKPLGINHLDSYDILYSLDFKCNYITNLLSFFPFILPLSGDVIDRFKARFHLTREEVHFVKCLFDEDRWSAFNKINIDNYMSSETLNLLILSVLQEGSERVWSRIVLLFHKKLSSINWEILRGIIFKPYPSLPINGDDLINRGMSQGPSIAKKLDEAMKIWVASGFNERALDGI